MVIHMLELLSNPNVFPIIMVFVCYLVIIVVFKIFGKRALLSLRHALEQMGFDRFAPKITVTPMTPGFTKLFRGLLTSTQVRVIIRLAARQHWKLLPWLV